MQEAVNNYHQQGFCIIPVAADSKVADEKWKSYQERKPTVKELASWFSDGHRNVAIVCGSVSGGLTVLDIDDIALADQLADDVPLRAETTMVRTPGGGLHVYAIETDAESRNESFDVPGRHVGDLRANGGYVLVPPSSIKGREYSILANTSIISVPNGREWAVGLLKAYGVEVPDRRGEPVDVGEVLAGVSEGQRDTELFRVACSLRRANVPQDMAEQLVLEAAANCTPPFPEGEARAKVANVYARYAPAATVKETDAPEPTAVKKGDDWPEPAAEEAFYGLAGGIVRTLEPHTEADPHALLADILTTFGMLVGLGPHFMVGLERHELRVWPVIVGPTGHGRKGLSHAQVVGVYVQAVEDFHKRLITGLSTGEGLIAAVHDPTYRKEAIKEGGRVVDYQDVMTDEGVADKRLLVVESEFGRTLRALRREGNTLSPVMRQAWDHGDMKTMTKTKVEATGAHVAIVAHITKEELLRQLDSTEAGSGFANRFFWIASRRSKLLPEGGRLPPDELNEIARKLREALAFASGIGEMRRDAAATDIWNAGYGELSQGKPGLFGAVVARSEAYVMRLACVYALMDKSGTVKAEHLMAALALWEYTERTVHYIFGDATGDATADTILRALRAKGPMTKTVIYDGLFGSHRSAERIAQALALLAELGLVVEQEIETGGRPAKIWAAK